MVLTRSASTVLGKRSHQDEAATSPTTSDFGKKSMPTIPEDESKKPKRTRTIEEDFDSRANKENVPPDNNTNTDPAIRTPSIRRTATESSLASPRNVRSLPRRTASTSKISASNRSTTTVPTTPLFSPPKALRPIYVRVRAALRPTCDGPENSLQGRDTERSVITEFLSAFSSGRADYTQTSLYVSGSPGTGKTALVHEMVRTFSTTEGIQVVYINCMGLKDISAMYDRMLEELPKSSPTKGRKLKGLAAVEYQLEALNKRCVLVLDELDHLTSTSGALSTIFALPQSNASKLRMIGIANTHTLTASLPLGDLDGVRTLHFKSYASDELLKIINSRLSSIDTESTVLDSVKQMLPANALMLLSKKVAAQTGDVRLLFEVLRGAIDRAVAVANKSADPLNTPAPIVTPAHILASLRASSTHAAGASAAPSGAPSLSETVLVMKVQELGFQPQQVLLMIILAYKRIEAGFSLSSTSSKNVASPSQSKNSIDAVLLHSYYTATLTRNVEATFSPASMSDFMDMLGLLEGVGVVHLTSESSSSRSPGSPSPSKRRKTMSRTSSLSSGVLNRTHEVSLAEGVRTEELLRGLGVADSTSKPATSDVKKEEAKALWRQECSRLAKEIKLREQSSLTKGDLEAAFEHARRSC